MHDDLYRFLGTLPNDGTMNQSLPITTLLNQLKVMSSKSIKNKRLQSIDLSAATDRLPVLLQAQILNILGFEGDL